MDTLPPLDPSKHYLGTLCKRGHEFEASGQSLRLIGRRDCVLCRKVNDREREDSNRWPLYRERYKDRYKGWTEAMRLCKVPPAQVEEMMRGQRGHCAVCGKSPDNGLFLDHCHKTMKPRALLCRRCNSGLGQFSDDVEMLRRAIDYLLAHQ